MSSHGACLLTFESGVVSVISITPFSSMSDGTLVHSLMDTVPSRPSLEFVNVSLKKSI